MSMLALADVGFADRGVIRPLIRRIALKSAVGEARVSVEALLDLLNEHREPLRSDGPSLTEQCIGLTARDLQRAISSDAISGGERNAMREDELLEGVKLVAQLLDRIEVGVRHGLFSCASDEEATRLERAPHRLCGGAK